MARYGIDYYGIGSYGSDNVATFSALPFTAQSFNYNKIKLTWVDPLGVWSNLILVRNQYGFPLNPYDGTVLVNVFNGSDPTNYTDVIPFSNQNEDRPFFDFVEINPFELMPLPTIITRLSNLSVITLDGW